MDIEGFLQSINGLSANTKRVYRQTLWQLYEHTHDDEPTVDEIYKFLSKYPASSLQRNKAAIKAYWEYIYPEARWPFGHRQFTPAREEIVRFLTVEQVNQLLNDAENEDDRMYILTLFTLGCRIKELMGIEEKDITPAGVQVLVKGNKYQLKVITNEFYEQLASYARGKKGRIFPRIYNYYYRTIKNLGKKAGIINISPHILRHARAVDLLNKTRDLSFVQQFLGHANINTTAKYLLVTKSVLGDKLEEVESNGRNN